MKLWCGIWEDENCNNECRIECLIWQNVVVEKWWLVWFNSNQVQNICMGRHENKHILQEDESVINWHWKEYSSQESSKEEVSWLYKSPSALFINFQNKSIEWCLGSLNFHNFKSLANNEHQEGWNNDWESKYNIGGHCCNFSGLSWIISIYKLHHREESKIEIAEHVVSNIGIEFVLRKLVSNPFSESIRKNNK